MKRTCKPAIDNRLAAITSIECCREDRDPRDELEHNFDALRRSGERNELLNFVEHLFRDGALAWRWDESDGEPVRIWRAKVEQCYIDLAGTITARAPSAFATLFAEGKVEFTVRSKPAARFVWRLVQTKAQ